MTLHSYTQNNSFFTYRYHVTNTTQGGAPAAQFGIVEMVFQHIESIQPPSFPPIGVGPGQNPPGWTASYILIEDNPVVDIYDVIFTSNNENNFSIIPGFQEQFYIRVRGPLGEMPVQQQVFDSLDTAFFHSFSGSVVSHFVDILDFDNAPPPLTPPILDNISIVGGQICFDISNMTIGALITTECNTDITNPTTWTTLSTFTATTTTENRCETIGNSSIFRAKAQ